MNASRDSSGPSEDLLFRLRAKMEDNAYQVLEDGDRKVLAFRVPGENIDLLRSLEYLAEFLVPDSIEGVREIVIISDKRFEVTPSSMIAPKLEEKKKEDERLFKELRGKLRKVLDPIVFTTENDILEMYRIGIRVEGSNKRSDSSIGLDLLKVELPKEGDVVYLIFEDGYRKMTRTALEKLVDDALTSLRQGPSLAKDPPSSTLSTARTIIQAKLEERTGVKESGRKLDSSRKASSMEPKIITREFSRNMASMGYRKDSMFSRHDVHQLFMIGLKGPAVFFKVMQSEDELDSFLRVLSHRKDALGVLISENWDPHLEAVSRINGFIYLDLQRSERAHEVIREVLKEGGSI
jgi:hypothetical protein